MREWTRGCSHTSEVVVSFPQVAEGSEHRVYLDAKNGLVFEATKPGLFGESYFIQDGKIAQKNCSPIDYVTRLSLWKTAFESAPEALGLTPEGQIVSSHRFIAGGLPAQTEVDSFLEGAGFVPVRKPYWLREKPYPQEAFAIGLGDARADHFVPIDVRLRISPEGRLEAR